MISQFSLFVFTTMAGLAAGACVASAFFPLETTRKRPWLFSLICIVFLAIGLVGCLTHLGHPERVLNALSNPTAGITQEAFATMLFGIVVFIEFLYTLIKKTGAPRWLSILEAITGIIMTFVMGFAYLENLGTPAWTNWSTVPLFVIGDLLMGFAFYALFSKGIYEKAPFSNASIAIQALFGVFLVFLAAHFSSVGESATPFIVAIVVATGGCIVLTWALRSKKSGNLVTAVFVCGLVGVCIARWFFYAGCTF
ncbi:MAG: dimethyl sulfoxide reductase anchor subunit family protein [Coriobacteriales bacterium]|jgi:DMSO reductase anchor subunit